jgi:hypothetical protein
MRLAWLGLVFLGCGASGAQPADGGGDLGVSSDLASSDLAGCNDPENQRPDGGVCLVSVSGKVVDEAGQPLPMTLVSICGDICFYGHAGADGTFVAPIKDHILYDRYAIEVHGRPDRASYYARLPPLSGETLDLPAPLVLPLLPATGPAFLTDKSQQDVSQGDITVHVAAGTDVMLDVEDVVNLPAGAQLRVLAPSPSLKAQLPFVDPAQPLDALYGFAPFEVIFSVKTPVEFKNSAALPANAAVDVLSQRGLLSGTPPAGNFQRVAGAHVSADGTKIVMDAGEGVTTLTWLALVKK